MDFNYLIGKLETLRIVIKDLTHDFKVNEDYIDELLDDIKHLKLRVEELDKWSDGVDVKRSRAEVENYKLKAENKELKVMLKDINENEDVIIIESRRDNYTLKAEIKSLEELIKAKHKKRNEDSNLIASLKAEIETLKDEAVKWNRKHYKLDEKYYELNKKHNDLIDNNTTKLKFH